MPKWASGAQKRKEAKKAQEAKQKYPKLSRYFQESQGNHFDCLYFLAMRYLINFDSEA